jgi:hypothetical protein
MGEAIVGELTGMRLQMMPSRIESFSRFKEFSPEGRLLNPSSSFRGHGSNPYVGYDTDRAPFLY